LTLSGNKLRYFVIDGLMERYREEIIFRNSQITPKKNIKKRNTGNKKHRQGYIPKAKLIAPPFESIFVPVDYYNKTAIVITNEILAERELYLIPGVIECGYGQLIRWTSDSIISNRVINNDMVAYSINRIRLAMSCISITPRRQYRIKDSFRYIEPSDKADVSFIAGGIFSYFTAVNWVDFHNERLKHFLHANLLTSTSLKLKKSYKTKSMPDYMVLTDSDNWHVFESKGGSDGNKWTRIQEGIGQLDIVTEVVWKNRPPVAVKSAVCTHASIDAGKIIEITAIDPESPFNHTLDLHASAVTLSNCILLLNLFHHFSSEGGITEFNEAKGWVFAKSLSFSNLGFGIPVFLLCYERNIRDCLGIFFAVKETLDILHSKKDIKLFKMARSICFEKIKGSRTARHLFWEKSVGYVFMLSYRRALTETATLLGMDELAESIDSARELLCRSIHESARKYLTPAGALSGSNLFDQKFWDILSRGDRPDFVAD